jgi:predicted transcriptional regulator
MAHLNVYISREREKWLRDSLEELARHENRSVSYIVEEALVKFIQQAGKSVPHDKRKDHRSRATR